MEPEARGPSVWVSLLVTRQGAGVWNTECRHRWKVTDVSVANGRKGIGTLALLSSLRF